MRVRGNGMDALVPDDLWAVVEPLLPPGSKKPKGGRPPASDQALAGIIRVLRTGMQLHADKAYGHCRCGHDCRARSITPRIARRRIESSEGSALTDASWSGRWRGWPASASTPSATSAAPRSTSTSGRPLAPSTAERRQPGFAPDSKLRGFSVTMARMRTVRGTLRYARKCRGRRHARPKALPGVCPG